MDRLLEKYFSKKD